MTKNSLPILSALLLASLQASGCYFFYDEGLHETDVKGKVVIKASAVGISSFADLSAEELSDFKAGLGMVYIGAWSGVKELQGFSQPTFDPTTQDSFPYGGASVGIYEYTGEDANDFLGCNLINGRFDTMPEIIDYFDIRVTPEDGLMSRTLDYKSYTADDEISADEAADLNLTGEYPKLTESQWVTRLLDESYFRFYQPPPNEGCQKDEDGNLLLETCDVSDFDFYGNVPWTVNSDGDLEAPFTMYKVFTPTLTEDSDEELYPTLWAFIDQDASSCYLYQNYPQSREYTLNYTCEYVSEGDLVSNYVNVQPAIADGSEVVIELDYKVPALTEEQITYVDSKGKTKTYGHPYCAY